MGTTIKQSIHDAKIGEDTYIADFVNLYGCKIGNQCKIGSFVEIQRGAIIGDRCKISSHSFICEGVKIGDGVFIGHGVVFTNDKYPRSVNEQGELATPDDWKMEETVVEDGVSIGSGATILCGIIIGKGALVGAGSVVTKNVPPGVVVYGNPAKINGGKRDGKEDTIYESLSAI